MPSYDNPDPKELGMNFHHGLVAQTFSISIVLSLVLIGCMIIFGIFVKDKTFECRYTIIGLLTSWAIIFLHVFADPLLGWFAD